ncbi:phage tail protein [Sphingomonas sp. IC-11]|uniref:GTA baseplate fiber-binding domain-containing protein n=1 Tax=Sphingomonas sp. IC-11 TaxID=2898528 RepID=UPI001E60C437|nr:phage tail protein [Sphingomonas sp. IC-11]MCD2317648.1 phage tail protein [Sphingomonas sp. IC-11]
MATLVLTTVGGLVGGPIGAALGGMVGQAADRNLLFKPKGRQGPRLTELAVQSSSYGRPIPRLFGRMRVAGQVIWAADLVEHRQREGGGKGQPGLTSYSYSASFAVALSARPIINVGRIWADGNLLRGAAGDWKVATGFRLYRGDEEQGADPLIASAEGVGQAPAHRGIAYIVFEDLPLAQFGNRIPSLTFEVIADPEPMPVGAIAGELSGGALSGEGPLQRLDGFSAYGDSVRGVVETLAEMSGAWFAPAGHGIAMRADTVPGRTVEDDGRFRRLTPAGRVPRSILVSHYDPDRDWQTGAQRAVRQGGSDAAVSIDLPAALSASAAKTIATAMLARAEAGRTRRRLELDSAAIDIAPGAVVTIAGEEQRGAWRVTAVAVERFRVTLELVSLAPPPIPARASGGRILRQPDAPAGNTILHAVELPDLSGALAMRPQLTIVAAGTRAGWRRAALHYSLDEGARWTAAGTTREPGVIGTLAQALGIAPSTMIDRRHWIDVDLPHEAMMLTGADDAALDRGANLATVGEELLQFGSARQIGSGRWRLTGLRRGRFGTPIHGAQQGARFVLLDGDSVATIPIEAAPGQRILVMANGVGDSVPVEASGVLSGRSLLPPAPVRLAARVLDQTLHCSWRRRSRTDWRWRDGIDTALAEEREAYRVTISTAGGTITLESEAPSVTVPLGATTPASGQVAVQQIGTHGLSAAATVSF